MCTVHTCTRASRWCHTRLVCPLRTSQARMRGAPRSTRTRARACGHSVGRSRRDHQRAVQGRLPFGAAVGTGLCARALDAASSGLYSIACRLWPTACGLCLRPAHLRTAVAYGQYTCVRLRARDLPACSLWPMAYAPLACGMNDRPMAIAIYAIAI